MPVVGISKVSSTKLTWQSTESVKKQRSSNCRWHHVGRTNTSRFEFGFPVLSATQIHVETRIRLPGWRGQLAEKRHQMTPLNVASTNDVFLASQVEE